MKLVESDSTVSYVSSDGTVKTAVVWIDVDDPDKYPWYYIRTEEGFSGVDKLRGLIRHADSESPVFTKLPKPEPKVESPKPQVVPAPTPEKPRGPRTREEAIEMNRRAAAAAIANRSRQIKEQNTTELSSRNQSLADAARRARNQSTSNETNRKKLPITGVTPEGPQRS